MTNGSFNVANKLSSVNHTNDDMPVIHGVESNKINNACFEKVTQTKGKKLINHENLKPLMQIVFKNYNNNNLNINC